MPLVAEGYFGTNADGSESREHCTYCFRGGRHTEPKLTLHQMADRSVQFMSQKLGYSEGRARELSLAIIPHLKRWRAPAEKEAR
jgi:hypothetical protein